MKLKKLWKPRVLLQGMGWEGEEGQNEAVQGAEIWVA